MNDTNSSASKIEKIRNQLFEDISPYSSKPKITPPMYCESSPSLISSKDASIAWGTINHELLQHQQEKKKKTFQLESPRNHIDFSKDEDDSNDDHKKIGKNPFFDQFENSPDNMNEISKISSKYTNYEEDSIYSKQNFLINSEKDSALKNKIHSLMESFNEKQSNLSVNSSNNVKDSFCNTRERQDNKKNLKNINTNDQKLAEGEEKNKQFYMNYNENLARVAKKNVNNHSNELIYTKKTNYQQNRLAQDTEELAQQEKSREYKYSDSEHTANNNFESINKKKDIFLNKDENTSNSQTESENADQKKESDGFISSSDENEVGSQHSETDHQELYKTNEFHSGSSLHDNSSDSSSESLSVDSKVKKTLYKIFQIIDKDRKGIIIDVKMPIEQIPLSILRVLVDIFSCTIQEEFNFEEFFNLVLHHEQMTDLLQAYFEYKDNLN